MYRSELTCDVIEWRELVTSLRTAAGGCADVHVGLVEVADKADIQVDRKVLADLAIHDKVGFTAIADQAKAALKAAY